MPELLSVSEAARELGLDPSRVRALITSGALAAEKVGGLWLVDRTSVASRVRQNAGAGRPLVARNAWALLLAASGDRLPEAIEPSARWRIRQSLRVYGLSRLRGRLVRRADVVSYWALPGELRALRERSAIALSGPSAATAYDLGLVGSDAVDAYVPTDLVRELEREHALEPASGPDANVVLRGVPEGAWFLGGRRVAPIAAVGVDLLAYADSRAARVGAEVIARLDREREAA